MKVNVGLRGTLRQLCGGWTETAFRRYLVMSCCEVRR